MRPLTEYELENFHLNTKEFLDRINKNNLNNLDYKLIEFAFGKRVSNYFYWFDYPAFYDNPVERKDFSTVNELNEILKKEELNVAFNDNNGCNPFYQIDNKIEIYFRNHQMQCVDLGKEKDTFISWEYRVNPKSKTFYLYSVKTNLNFFTKEIEDSIYDGYVLNTGDKYILKQDADFLASFFLYMYSCCYISPTERYHRDYKVVYKFNDSFLGNTKELVYLKSNSQVLEKQIGFNSADIESESNMITCCLDRRDDYVISTFNQSLAGYVYSKVYDYFYWYITSPILTKIEKEHDFSSAMNFSHSYGSILINKSINDVSDDLHNLKKQLVALGRTEALEKIEASTSELIKKIEHFLFLFQNQTLLDTHGEVNLAFYEKMDGKSVKAYIQTIVYFLTEEEEFEIEYDPSCETTNFPKSSIPNLVLLFWNIIKNAINHKVNNTKISIKIESEQKIGKTYLTVNVSNFIPDGEPFENAKRIQLFLNDKTILYPFDNDKKKRGLEVVRDTISRSNECEIKLKAEVDTTEQVFTIQTSIFYQNE